MAMLQEMLPRGGYFAFRDPLGHVGVLGQIPRLVEFRRAGQPAFEIAGMNKMVTGRLYQPILQCLG